MLSGQYNHNERKNNKVLLFSFLFTLGFSLTEVICGFTFSSLSLLSEGFHMTSDAVSMFLSLLALTIGMKLANSKRTFGFRRIETLAAFINGIALLVIPVIVVFTAIKRFIYGSTAMGPGMLKIAILGLIINLIVAYILSKGDKENNLNMRAAFLHVFADLMSSISVIVASLLIIYFGWTFVDPLVSLIVSIIIFVGGVEITKDAWNILMEGTPKDLNLEELKTEITSVEGVKEISDIRVWSIASDEHYLNVHINVEKNMSQNDVLSHIKVIAKKYDLQETIQIN